MAWQSSSAATSAHDKASKHNEQISNDYVGTIGARQRHFAKNGARIFSSSRQNLAVSADQKRRKPLAFRSGEQSKNRQIFARRIADCSQCAVIVRRIHGNQADDESEHQMSITMTAKKQPRILNDDSATLRAEIAALKAENAKLSAATPITFRVSTKGAVSLYGVGRWPVTLYAGQWQSVLDNIDALRAFINANRSKLATKKAD